MKQKTSLSLRLAMLPIVALVLLLSLNVSVYGDDALGGSNQFILLLGGAVAAMVGFGQKISYKDMLQQVAENLKSVTGAILILLFDKNCRVSEFTKSNITVFNCCKIKTL